MPPHPRPTAPLCYSLARYRVSLTRCRVSADLLTRLSLWVGWGPHSQGVSLGCPLMAVLRRLCPSLVLLVLLNVMLFYKLWTLEYTTQTLTAWQGLRLQER